MDAPPAISSPNGYHPDAALPPSGTLFARLPPSGVHTLSSDVALIGMASAAIAVVRLPSAQRNQSGLRAVPRETGHTPAKLAGPLADAARDSLQRCRQHRLAGCLPAAKEAFDSARLLVALSRYFATWL